jgi:hypothetical protein
LSRGSGGIAINPPRRFDVLYSPVLHFFERAGPRQRNYRGTSRSRADWFEAGASMITRRMNPDRNRIDMGIPSEAPAMAKSARRQRGGYRARHCQGRQQRHGRPQGTPQRPRAED